MSPPDTDIDKQAKRHRGPLVGITAGLIFVAIVAIGAFIWNGLPLGEQAAPDGEPTEVVPEDAATGTDGDGQGVAE